MTAPGFRPPMNPPAAPPATPLLIRGGRVVTPEPAVRRGEAMNGLRVVPDADVLIEGGVISRVEPRLHAPVGARVIDAAGRVVMPGFVDAHTHACFAGDRLDEWELKRRGVPYLDILKSGGGIMSTVRATRAASEGQLTALLADRIERMLRAGSTTVEVKSGYGLSTAAELKMLRAVHAASASPEGDPPRPTVVSTALLGHAIDPDLPRERFISSVIDETLPAVVAEFGAIAVDAFAEDGAWSADECWRLFERAAALGCPCRVHADQFHSLGLVERAAGEDRRGASVHPGHPPPIFRTVDHLEASSPATLRSLGASGVIGVLLPCTGFHTDGRYADGRALIDAGGAVAVATNYNPGSSPCWSMPMAIALAVRFNGLTPAEAITAATANAAAALGLSDRGSIAPGLIGDVIVLHHRDERLLAYEFGGDPIAAVVKGGRVVRGVQPAGG